MSRRPIGIFCYESYIRQAQCNGDYVDKISARLPTNSAVAERIAAGYPLLTTALRGFADFVLSEPLTAARLSVHAAGREAGVSVATANRFARTLGYSGYPEFRSELIKSFDPAYEPVRRLSVNLRKPASSLDIMRQSLELERQNIEATLHDLSEASCERAVALILEAQRIFVAGLDNSGHLAMLLANGLELYCLAVHTVGNVGGAVAGVRKLTRFGRGDLMIAIAFPRYLGDTVRLTALAKERGVKVIAITDRPSSPLVELADVVLYVRAERQFASTSDASVLSVIEALCAAVAHHSAGAEAAAIAYTDGALPWFEMPKRRPKPTSKWRHRGAKQGFR
jgi:DNA-binding MurR/RpiR family transcriptional regulator